MKGLFCLLALSLVGFKSFANFTGQWKGEAILTGKEGRKFLCEDVEINVTHKKEQLEFGDFYYGCGGLGIRFRPPTLVYVNETEVKWKDQIVGPVTDKEARLTFVINDRGGRARYTSKKLGDTKISYKDEQYEIDPKTGQEVNFTIIEGTLSR